MLFTVFTAAGLAIHSHNYSEVTQPRAQNIHKIIES